MNRKTWTEDEIAVLQAMYPTVASKDIAAMLGRTSRQVLEKAWSLGLKKTREAISDIARCSMADPNHPARRHQFAKGIAPWNKGTSYQAGGRSAETQFKPGQKPHTWNPIGHEREIKGGYLQRKVRDTGFTRRDYMMVHHLVWIAAGNDIPPGHALLFRDGNKRNFALDNLELVSRSELMRRNSVHNYGPEIARLHQLQGAIQRQINKRISKKEGKAK
jgi:hypothetical protein